MTVLEQVRIRQFIGWNEVADEPLFHLLKSRRTIHNVPKCLFCDSESVFPTSIDQFCKNKLCTVELKLHGDRLRELKSAPSFRG